MKETFVIILVLFGLSLFGQENSFENIILEVIAIETNSTLVQTEYDWAELKEISTDGGIVLSFGGMINRFVKL